MGSVGVYIMIVLYSASTLHLAWIAETIKETEWLSFD